MDTRGGFGWVGSSEAVKLPQAIGFLDSRSYTIVDETEPSCVHGFS
jgi:hypothetical protein